jgi:hypothetical protein
LRRKTDGSLEMVNADLGSGCGISGFAGFELGVDGSSAGRREEELWWCGEEKRRKKSVIAAEMVDGYN